MDGHGTTKTERRCTCGPDEFGGGVCELKIDVACAWGERTYHDRIMKNFPSRQLASAHQKTRAPHQRADVQYMIYSYIWTATYRSPQAVDRAGRMQPLASETAVEKKERFCS